MLFTAKGNVIIAKWSAFAENLGSTGLNIGSDLYVGCML
jgi:hypothetical protein